MVAWSRELDSNNFKKMSEAQKLNKVSLINQHLRQHMETLNSFTEKDNQIWVTHEALTGTNQGTSQHPNAKANTKYPINCGIKTRGTPFRCGRLREDLRVACTGSKD